MFIKFVNNKVRGMNYIELKRNENEQFYYKPLFVVGNYIYVGRDSCIDEDCSNILNFEYLGLSKYNMQDGLIKDIDTSGKITRLFYAKHNNHLSYVLIEDKINSYMAHLYQIDIESDRERELFSLEIQKCAQDSPIEAAQRLNSIFLNDRYIMYLIDIVGNTEERWISTFNSNKYELYIYDILEDKKYQVLDESFYFHGFNKMVITKVDDVDYLIINAAEYPDCDRYDSVYMWENLNNIEYRGLKEAIYVIPVDTLVEETKVGRDKISYKQIDSIGREGTVRLGSVDGSKIYYRVDKYRVGGDLFEYDIRTEEYEKIKYDNLYINDITSNQAVVNLDKDMNTHLQELKLKDNRRIINTSMNILNGFLGFLESRYLIYREYEIVANEVVRFVYIYDIQTKEIIEKLEGNSIVFPEKNLIVSYQRC